ncbi:hypothetical protein GCM10008983_03760 [Lentibacillus halophilus]|uniref:Uncharacterized protein n=1 Tax=Lentibacillus halophilus TaxID=295065 RepID=A0ABN0Z2V2_9BACI
MSEIIAINGVWGALLFLGVLLIHQGVILAIDKNKTVDIISPGKFYRNSLANKERRKRVFLELIVIGPIALCMLYFLRTGENIVYQAYIFIANFSIGFFLNSAVAMFIAAFMLSKKDIGYRILVKRTSITLMTIGIIYLVIYFFAASTLFILWSGVSTLGFGLANLLIKEEK